MAIFNFKTAREFRNGIDESNPFPNDLRAQRWVQIGSRPEYPEFFCSIYDSLAGINDFYRDIRSNQQREEVHETGQLVALGIMFGKDRNKTLITSAGLQETAKVVKKYEDYYFNLFSALAHYEQIFNGCQSIDSLDGVGQLAPRRNDRARAEFFCGYVSTFMAAFNSGTLRNTEIPEYKTPQFYKIITNLKILGQE